MKKMRIASSIVSLLGYALAAGQNVQSAPTNAGLTKLMQAEVLQQKLSDCDFSSSNSRTIAGVKMITTPDGDVLLSGADRLAHKWSVYYAATPGGGCQLWAANLSLSGKQDLIFVGFGGNSSGGWDTALLLILFDDQGRPFPWQATSKFTVGDSGIRELVHLDPDARPAIIISQLQSDDQSTNIYRYSLFGFKGNKVEELVGLHADINWPLVLPPRSRALAALQGSLMLATAQTDALDPQKPTYFKGIRGLNDSEREVVLTDGVTRMPELLVVDSPTGRSIISSPVQSDLQNIKADTSAVEMLGKDCSQESCRPVVMWVRQ